MVAVRRGRADGLGHRRRAEAGHRGHRGRVRRRGAVDHGHLLARQRGRREAGGVGPAGHRLQARRGVGHGTSDRPGRVLGLGDRQDAVGGDDARRVGLSATTPATPAGAMICAESVDASGPTVSAARPAAVDAAAPAGRAGRRPVRVGRQQHLPAERRVALGHVGVEQAVQLGDVGLAQHDRARGLQLRRPAPRQPLGIDFCSAIEPPVVGRPLTSMTSSSRTGMPCSGPRTPRGRALAVEQPRLLESVRVQRPHRLQRRALRVGQRDPRQVGLGQRLGARACPPSCGPAATSPTPSPARTEASAPCRR